MVEVAREGLQLELRAAVLAANQGRPTLNRKLSVRINGDFHGVGFSVRALSEPDAGEALLPVSFQQHAKTPDKAVGTAPKERKRTAAPAEQAQVEELETSKEELQSVNEELITVNTELRSKLEGKDLLQESQSMLDILMPIGRVRSSCWPSPRLPAPPCRQPAWLMARPLGRAVARGVSRKQGKISGILAP